MAVKISPPPKPALDRKGAGLTLIGAVRTARHHLHTRVAIVALLLVAWVLFTNHCALGMMRPMGHATEKSGHCCGGKSGSKHDGPSELRSCCNIKATTAPATVELKFDASKFEFQLFALLQVLTAWQEKSERSVAVFDHGPPRLLSFAESVLQRSLLSHAPPFAV